MANKKTSAMRLLLSILFITFILLGCKNSKDSTTKEPLIIRIVSLDNPVESLPLSDAISKLEIVPLETSEESVIKNIKVVTLGKDDDIYIGDDQNILRFSSDGRFLNTIGKVGQGPGEYTYINDIQWDEINNLLYVYSSHQILLFTPAGEFIRRYNTKPIYEIVSGIHGGGFRLFKNTFFWKDRMPLAPDKSTFWNFGLADQSGEIVKTFTSPAYKGNEEDIITNHALLQGWKNYWAEPEKTPIEDFYNSEFKIMYYGVDTIYKYNELAEDFQHYYTIELPGERPSFKLAREWGKDLSFWKYAMIQTFWETKDYIYLIIGKDASKFLTQIDKQTGSVIYSEHQGTIFERKFPGGINYSRRDVENIGFKDDLSNFNKPFYPTWTTSSYWICSYDAPTLLEEENKNNASEQVKAITKQLKEDDNPVLFIAKLK